MTRWILSSIALHAALVIFVFFSALLSRPEKEEDIFVVDLSAGMEASDPAPEETPAEPEPEPTEAEEVTKAPTKEPTKKETQKPVPTKKETPPPKPTRKKVVDTSPRKLPDKLRPTPPPEPRRPDPRERLREVADEIDELVNKPVPDPPKPVPTRRTVQRTTQNTNTSRLDVSTSGGRRNSNYYLAMLQNQLYKNWDHKARQGSPRKGEVTIVVRKDGTIDINRCEWNRRSGEAGFDDSVWEALKKVDLPNIPDQLSKAEITVTVTFRDEV
jgi:outer membrane biosynthesis protein TonB